MTRATLTLPWPPSVNNLYATFMGRRVLSRLGRKYHAAVAEAVAKQGIEGFGSARIRYCVTAFPPDKRRRDLSNLTKIVEDSLTKALVWADDYQVDHLEWIRGHVAPGGSLFIEISEIEND